MQRSDVNLPSHTLTSVCGRHLEHDGSGGGPRPGPPMACEDGRGAGHADARSGPPEATACQDTRDNRGRSPHILEPQSGAAAAWTAAHPRTAHLASPPPYVRTSSVLTWRVIPTPTADSTLRLGWPIQRPARTIMGGEEAARRRARYVTGETRGLCAWVPVDARTCRCNELKGRLRQSINGGGERRRGGQYATPVDAPSIKHTPPYDSYPTASLHLLSRTCRATAPPALPPNAMSSSVKAM